MSDADPSEEGRARRSSSIPPSLRAAWSASADRYRALIEAADDAILVVDFDARMVLEANPAAGELFGFAVGELVEVPLGRLHKEGDEEIARVLREITERERAWHPNLSLACKDGSTFWAELRAKVFESGDHKLVLFIVRDVTARVEREQELARAYQSLKDTQARLVHSGKLAAIGQIAGGVAHEVNNPATFILTNLRVMRENVAVFRGLLSRLRRELARPDTSAAEKLDALEVALDDGSADALLRETNEMVDDNLSGIERIASIVNDLRTFSRIEHDDVREVKVNDLVDVACNLAYADIRHRARLIKELARLPAVRAEPGKLAQVFTNLIVNAAHSIEEGAANDNEIRVSTFLDGGFVVIRVQDTGVRIPDDVRARLFEPFYSTSAKDYGTGLGLSLCSEIVRLHGGTLEVATGIGRGNRFEVRLPAPDVAPEATPVPVAPAVVPSRAKRARILVIDDDVAVLRAYRRMLSARHDVVLAGGGAEGLDVLARDSGFDIVLCDVMMPQVDGPMVYEALRGRSPSLLSRLVFCSGGAFTPRAKEFLASVENAFLAKPIDMAALEAAIELMRQRRADAPH
jgi:two-component system, cell cycle sensor histidine kinase and response regulator CckA